MDPQFDPSFRRFTGMSDAYTVAKAQRGDNAATEYLLYKYRNLVRTKVRSYFLVGAEREDLLQVGMIGLWQAVMDFRSVRAMSFPAFAKVCVQRHIITAIKTATRLKQVPLNSSLSFEAPGGDWSGEWSLLDLIPAADADDPEERVLQMEDTRILQAHLKQVLSDFEWHVLAGYQLGKSYREIARELGCNTKSVDNALGRIKRKVASVDTGCARLGLELFMPCDHGD